MKGISTLRIRWPRSHRPDGVRGRFVPPTLLAAVTLVLVTTSLFFKGIQSRELWASHEARAAQNAQGMLDDGNWLLPRLYDGQVEMQKPPGYYWVAATAGAVRGEVDALAVRLPAALAGTFTVLMVWWHLRQRERPVAALAAGAVLAGAVHFTGTARIARIDVPLACVVTAMLLVGRDMLERGPSRRAVALLGLVGGAALLLKGPIGVVLPAAVMGAWCFWDRRSLRRVVGPALLAGAIALALAIPWFVWANVETDGEFVRTFFLYHHVNRAFGGAPGLAGHPWWYYVPRFAADFQPWTPLVVLALVAGRWRGDADARFGILWLVAMVVVLSASRFKRADYLLPAYPGAAIFLGCALERWYLTRTSRTRVHAACGFAIVLAFLPLGWLVFDRTVTSRLEAARDQRPFASIVRTAAPIPQSVVLFQVESHSLAFHLGRPVHTLVEWADLNAHLTGPGLHYVVTRAESLDEVQGFCPGRVAVLARSTDASAVRPHRPLVLLQIHGETWPSNPPKD